MNRSLKTTAVTAVSALAIAAGIAISISAPAEAAAPRIWDHGGMYGSHPNFGQRWDRDDGRGRGDWGPAVGLGVVGPSPPGDVMPFFRDQSFDPEAVAAMRDAFRLAWDVLPAKQQLAENQRVLADAILHLAADGERDPERLCAYALTAVPPAKAS
jgi:hypothetical protein